VTRNSTIPTTDDNITANTIFYSSWTSPHRCLNATESSSKDSQLYCDKQLHKNNVRLSAVLIQTPLTEDVSSSDQDKMAPLQNMSTMTPILRHSQEQSAEVLEDVGSVSDEDTNEEFDEDDRLSFDGLTHRPPFIPSVPAYSGSGKPNLRQSVISRQSTRLYPINDNVREHMEQSLVRWDPPQSSFRFNDILNGKQAFQKGTMPILEANKASLESQTDQTTSVDNFTTDDTSNSGRSPYVSMTISSTVPNHIGTSREIKIGSDFEDAKALLPPLASNSPFGSDLNSIQDSAYFNFQEYPDNLAECTSPSIKSFYLNRLFNQEDPEKVIDSNDEPKSLGTPEAYPLTEQDLSTLMKTANHSVDNQQASNTVSPTFNQNSGQSDERFCEDNDGCLLVTSDAFSEMWKDLWMVLTCKGCPISLYNEYPF
jgi:hypothetical protein